MTHHRLFVAFPLPVIARSALLATMGGVAGARWQTDAQLHCTIRFIGEIDRRRVEDVVAVLGRLSHPPIDGYLDKLGAFDRGGRTDTIWIGMHPAAALFAVHAKIGRLLERAGVSPDTRAYHPHVTIARFSRRSMPPSAVAAIMPPPPRITCRLDEVRLYESILGSEGACYETVERYPLG